MLPSTASATRTGRRAFGRNADAAPSAGCRNLTEGNEAENTPPRNGACLIQVAISPRRPERARRTRRPALVCQRSKTPPVRSFSSLASLFCPRSVYRTCAAAVLAALAVSSARAAALTINGPSNYQLQPDGLTVRITTTFTNTSATPSAALQLQLWAFALPFNAAAAQTGYRLATVNLASLPAGASYANISPVALYNPPASGV